MVLANKELWKRVFFFFFKGKKKSLKWVTENDLNYWSGTIRHSGP